MKENVSMSIEVEFRFNSVHQAILIPRDGKGKQLLQLCFGERNDVRIATSPGSNPDWIVIEARPTPMKEMEPKYILPDIDQNKTNVIEPD